MTRDHDEAATPSEGRTRPHQVHGRVVSTPTGDELHVTRSLPVEAADAWRWVTESNLTARWYGPWAGVGRPGGLVRITMASEEGTPESVMRVIACDPPHRFAVESMDPPPWNWRLEVECIPAPPGSTVTLRRRDLSPDIDLRDIGPGWEFYLARLVAAVKGDEAAPFQDFVRDLTEAYAGMR